MKHFFYILTIFCLFSCSSKIPTRSGSNQDKFQWSSQRKITWEDFKGHSASRNAVVSATTSCRFGYRINPDLKTVLVTNEFICYQSSVKPDRKTPALLAHEQLHFDLCEVYARRLRQSLAVATLTPNNIESLTKEIFLSTYSAYKAAQSQYDEETNHGLEPQAQARWSQKITQALQELSAYAL